MCSVCATFKGIVISDSKGSSKKVEHGQGPPVSHEAEANPGEQEVDREQEEEDQRFKESVNDERHDDDFFHPFDLEDNESNGGFHPIITGRREEYASGSDSEEGEGDNDNEKSVHSDDEWESINSADEEDGEEPTTSSPLPSNDSHLEDPEYTYVASFLESDGSLNGGDSKTALEVNPKTNREASSDVALEVSAEANLSVDSKGNSETVSQSDDSSGGVVMKNE